MNNTISQIIKMSPFVNSTKDGIIAGVKIGLKNVGINSDSVRIDNAVKGEATFEFSTHKDNAFMVINSYRYFEVSFDTDIQREREVFRDVTRAVAEYYNLTQPCPVRAEAFMSELKEIRLRKGLPLKMTVGEFFDKQHWLTIRTNEHLTQYFLEYSAPDINDDDDDDLPFQDDDWFERENARKEREADIKAYYYDRI